jgi:O-antigen/teichoic acid export membrane protein
MNKEYKNILINYLTTLASGVLPLIALPFFINKLGIFNWGIISTVLLILILSNMILDSGLAQVSLQYITRKELNDKLNTDKLSGVEYIYWSIACLYFAFASIIYICINNNFFSDISFGINNLKIIIYYSSFYFLVQFPSSYYKAYLSNSNDQLLINISTMMFSISRTLGLLIYINYDINIENYLFLQLLFYIIELVFRKFLMIIFYKNIFIPKLNIYIFIVLFKEIKSYYSGSILGIFISQSDKIFINYFYSIEIFGIYSAANSFSNGIGQLFTPVIQSYTPIILRTEHNSLERTIINKKLFKINAFLSFNIVIIYYFLCDILLKNYLTKYVSIVEFLNLLLIGVIFNSFYQIVHFNWLSDDNSKIIKKANIIGFIYTLISPIIILYYGPVAATFNTIIPCIISISLFFLI